MEAEPNWAQLLDQALGEARSGDETPVPGAKLRISLDRVARDAGIDLASYLRSRSLSFSTLIGQIDGFRVIRRPGTDILVARATDEIHLDAITGPTPRANKGIRPDLYTAFTRLSSPFKSYYDPAMDRVVHVPRGAEPPPADLPPFPEPSLDEHIDLRQRFADSHPSPELTAALADSAAALSRFRVAVHSLRLEHEWHAFQYEALSQKLLHWAETNNLQVRPDWLSRHQEKRRIQPSIGTLLSELANYMSEDELSEVKVPLPAVYKFWISQLHRRQ